MKKRILLAVLVGLSSFLHGYYIYHPAEDLSRPEAFWPDRFGQKPGPGRPMARQVIFMDRKLLRGGGNEGAVKQALSTWSGVEGSTARLVYGGTVELTGSFGDRLGLPDGRNTIELVTSEWFFGSYLVALTWLQFDEYSGKITEADVFLNGQDYRWGGYPLSGTPADTRNILTHELGHFLGLGHSQFRAATMSATTRPSEFRRSTLHWDDEQGLRWLYPASSADIPPPSLWGLARGWCGIYWPYLSGPLVFNASPNTDSFCLYGAGMTGMNFSLQLVSQKTGQPLWPIYNVAPIDQNMLTLDMDLSQLAPDSYRLELLQEDGKAAAITQAVIVRQGGMMAPVAQITPASEIIQQGDAVWLDGSGSSAQEGLSLNYHWLVLDSPVAFSLETETGSGISFQPDKPGDYVLGLMVDDGTNYSTIAESLITVLKKSDDDESAFGCHLNPEAQASGLSPLLVPALFYLLVRMRRRTGKRP